MQKQYKYEELIKTYTTREYEQEGGEILMKCYGGCSSMDNKALHIQLDTGKFYCENRMWRGRFSNLYINSTADFKSRG